MVEVPHECMMCGESSTCVRVALSRPLHDTYEFEVACSYCGSVRPVWRPWKDRSFLDAVCGPAWILVTTWISALQ